MNEEQLIIQLFQLAPKLQTLTFYFDGEGRFMLPFLNGVNWGKSYAGELDLSSEADKSFMVEVDFTEVELNNLLVGLHFLSLRTWQGKSRQWLFINRSWTKALTIKQVLEKEDNPFPYFDIHRKVQQVFLENPQLSCFTFVKRYGALRVMSRLDGDEVQIKANWIPAPLEYPSFLANVPIILSLADNLQDVNMNYGSSFFNSSFYL